MNNHEKLKMSAEWVITHVDYERGIITVGPPRIFETRVRPTIELGVKRTPQRKRSKASRRLERRR